MATAPPPSPPTWSCAVCDQEMAAGTRAVPIHAAADEAPPLVCVPCLHERFSSALEREYDYPVAWGAATIHPRDFSDLFDGEFLAAYARAESQYQTPANKRVYCTSAGGCGMFLGERCVAPAETVWCNCVVEWCLACGEKWEGMHQCQPEKMQEEREKALEGLEKGKDYQKCPGEGCGMIIELAEACNSVLCKCGLEFCYLCGEAAKECSDHWYKKDDGSGCPKWGSRETGTFEEDLSDDDDDDDDVDEELLEDGPLEPEFIARWENERQVIFMGHGENGHEPAGINPAQVVEVWEQGAGGLTSFNFQRWTWYLAMQVGGVEREIWSIREWLAPHPREAERDLALLLEAMVTWAPFVRDDISNMHWNAIVQTQNQWGVTDDWLRDISVAARNRGALEAFLGGPLPLLRLDHLFNVADEANSRAGARWAQVTNAWALAYDQGATNMDFFPGMAIFDVGPDDLLARKPARYNIREMEMFRGLEALQFCRLHGNALLVLPRNGANVLEGWLHDPERAVMRPPWPFDWREQPAGGQINPQPAATMQQDAQRVRTEWEIYLLQFHDLLPHEGQILLWWFLWFFICVGNMLTIPVLRAHDHPENEPNVAEPKLPWSDEEEVVQNRVPAIRWA